MRTRYTKLSRAAIALSAAFLIACWLISVPRLATHVRAQAQACGAGQTSIQLISGNGVLNGMDSQVQFSTDGGTTFHSAFILAPNAGFGFPYDTIPGTQWVAVNSDFTGPVNAHYTFRTTFTLPASFTSPSLNVQVLCDNVATAFLNGNLVGGQPDAQIGANFQNPPTILPMATTPGFFHAGLNELTFDVHNFDIITGLDFSATVCFTPAQGCVDQTPPSVSCNVEENQLWPANHDLENVGLTAHITDDCDCFSTGHDGDDDDDDDDDGHHGSSASGSSATSNGSSAGSSNNNHHDDGDDDDDDDGHCHHASGGSHSVAVTVYSDEPDLDIPGSGNFSPDAKNIGLGSLRLRSERSGNGDGRVYLIVVKATDASGKVGYCAKTVTVPHDQSNASKNSVTNQANAAKAYFMANHVEPPNYVQVGIGPIVGPKQ